MRPLSSIKKGEKCRIESFNDAQLGQKMMEMGFLPGEVVKVEQFAPFGNPIAISLEPSLIGIRSEEAQTVMVTLLDE
ncbi:MAG TPA: FeoA family protein [Bacteroidia bacterium]|nr:FeoA family protein [Bacteroidia bacterium]HNT79705.1 FeoA family protein [Bacteroidia bacterium]